MIHRFYLTLLSDEFEEKWIKHYFENGYEYKEILEFLEKYHDVKISLSTLLRRLRSYGLQRKIKAGISIETVTLACEFLESNLEGPASSNGYRANWHSLQSRGIQIPRNLVQILQKQLDPAGTHLRRRNRLKRRVYSNIGPDFSWHIDGHDKIKPFGFPIHAAIDGYSRKIIWLKVLRSNNCPKKIGELYLNSIKEFGGCPVQIITDLGTENALVAAMQTYFWQDFDAHRYVPSPRNQRIESWWSFFTRSRGAWWREFFLRLESDGTYDSTNIMDKECLWYCFSSILQKDLDEVKSLWNSHRIRRSRFGTIPGRPDVLYYLPRRSGGEENLKLPIPSEEIERMKNQHTQVNAEQNEYEEYFQCAQTELSIPTPNSANEALALFISLLNVANFGF